MNILVTGFQPFGDHALNPSARLAEALDGTECGGRQVNGLVLPVEVETAPALLQQAVETLQPEIVLSLGLAGSRAALAIERVAINVLDFALPDNGGRQPIDDPVIPGGPAAYFATVPVRRISAAWRSAGLPGYVSNTAGTYLCNQILYVALHLGQEHGFRAGFIHTPCLPEQVTRPSVPSMSFDLMLRGVQVALEVAISAPEELAVPAGAIS